MSEENGRPTENVRREPRGAPPRRLETEVEQAVGGTALDFDTGIGTSVPSPVETPGELSKSKESFEIDDSCTCGSVPELAVDKGEVGRWRFQVVYCEGCMHRFGAAVTPVENDEAGEGEGDE